MAQCVRRGLAMCGPTASSWSGPRTNGGPDLTVDSTVFDLWLRL